VVLVCPWHLAGDLRDRVHALALGIIFDLGLQQYSQKMMPIQFRAQCICHD